jgi:hypothetical protein
MRHSRFPGSESWLALCSSLLLTGPPHTLWAICAGPIPASYAICRQTEAWNTAPTSPPLVPDLRLGDRHPTEESTATTGFALLRDPGITRTFDHIRGARSLYPAAAYGGTLSTGDRLNSVCSERQRPLRARGCSTRLADDVGRRAMSRIPGRHFLDLTANIGLVRETRQSSDSTSARGASVLGPNRATVIIITLALSVGIAHTPVITYALTNARNHFIPFSERHGTVGDRHRPFESYVCPRGPAPCLLVIAGPTRLCRCGARPAD